MKTLILSILLILFSAVVYGQTIPLTGCTPGNLVKHVSGGVPAFDVQTQAGTTCLLGIYLTNLSPGDLIVTLHDAASQFFYQITVPANSSAPPFNFPNGLEFDNGLFWQASGPGVVASYIAVQ